MIFEWIGFIWLTLLIIYYTLKWLRGRRRAIEFRARMREYDKEPMTMSISERLGYKSRMAKKR